MKDKIRLVKGDITKLKVDAIVNAANTSLLDGSGVNGAIHAAAGPELLAECQLIGDCAPGQAKITKGYRLPAKYVIHAVGPIWRGGAKSEAKLLADCYSSAMKLALKHHIKTIAFPAISCGIYGYPVKQASAIAVKEISHFMEMHPEIESVDFVCFTDDCYEAYQQAMEMLSH
jgi:O-acetyl-ADP-ribose deacetylase (regulator of RNase III)